MSLYEDEVIGDLGFGNNNTATNSNTVANATSSGGIQPGATKADSQNDIGKQNT